MDTDIFKPIDKILVGKLDVGTVSNDADEVGIFWAGPILNKVLIPLGNEFKLPVKVIGHSFGCRVVFQGLSSYKLYETQPNSVKPDAIGMQCAFSGNRFIPEQIFEKDKFDNFSEVTKHVFLTASKHDLALGIVAKTNIPYVGSDSFFQDVKTKDKYQNSIHLSTYTPPKEYKPKLDCSGKKANLIDAQSIINSPAPGTGEKGGAHSKVWDNEAGTLIWNLMNVCN